MSSIKDTYHKYINDRNRKILRWIFLIGITIYLIASATPYEGVVERSTARNVLFWLLNGLLLLIVGINLVLSIYAAIKKSDRQNVGNALCSIVVAVLLLLFVLDIYNHNVFYAIKQAIINLFSGNAPTL